MPGSGPFLRQLSRKEPSKSTSRRWGGGGGSNSNKHCWGESEEGVSMKKQMEGLNLYGNGGSVVRKRVMVVVDETSHSKHAMMWALTHLASKGDLLTLLHIIPLPTPNHDGNDGACSQSPYLANSLGSLCKACKPEVEVEGLVIQGPKLATVMSQVKKLDVTVLVLGQKKPSTLLFSCFCGKNSNEEFVEQCINGTECMTIGVRKQSRGMGGYLISTRWQKNFWLLA